MKPFAFRPLVLLLVYFVFGCSGGPMAPDAGLVAIPSGDRIKISDFRGKVVLIDFWATWCSPCLANMPSTQRLLDEYRDRGFEVLAVSNEDRKKLEGFSMLERYSFRWCQDDLYQATERYGVEAVPHAVLIGRDGGIRWVGNPGDTEVLRKQIELAL